MAPGRPVQRARRGRPGAARRAARRPASPSWPPGSTPTARPLVDAHRLPAHARHRPVLGAHHAQPRRHRGLAAVSPPRRGRAVGAGRAASGGVDRHRGPGVRRPDARPPRPQPRPLRPVLGGPDLVVGRDVEPGEQGRPAPPPTAGHAVRRLRIVGGGGPGRVGVDRRPRRADGASSCSARAAPCSPRTADGSSRAPASRGWWPSPAHLPLGYYKDEAKTAQTFRTFEGRRWSVPGDWAEVEADGSLRLLGRGSVCINTGGEKVFPEEVEEALKTHASVRDAVCVGDPRRPLRRGDLRRRRGRAGDGTGRGGPARPRQGLARCRTRPPATWSWSTPSGERPTARSTTRR